MKVSCNKSQDRKTNVFLRMICSNLFSTLKKNLQIVLILSGAVLGIFIGISINESVQKLKQPDRYTAIVVLGFPGELLLRTLKMLILPLITFNLIDGLSNLDSRVSSKVGLKSLAFYLTSMGLAAIVGITLVSSIKPGEGMGVTKEKSDHQEIVRPLDSLMDIVRFIFFLTAMKRLHLVFPK